MRRITDSTFAIAIACAALAGTATPGGAQTAIRPQHIAPTTVSVTCSKAADTEVIASDAYDHTSSTSWVNLTDGLVNFVSKKSGCVIVTLSGPSAANSDYLLAQVVLDGTTACAPSAIGSQIFASSQLFDEAHSMTYLCANVVPGVHSIQAQYRSYYGIEADFNGHTLTVAHE